MSFDIIFISFNESNAEINWKTVVDRFPKAKRLCNIKGIHRAHFIAANMVSTDLFYVIDGDATILPEFNFDYKVDSNQLDWVHVFRAKNPINDLVYGYGGVKLLPTDKVMTLFEHKLKPDMTSSIPNIKYNVVHQISNITNFNTSPFNTWRSAFRECTKLSSKVIDRQKSNETEERLNVWCTVGSEKMFGEFALDGAKKGREYGYKNKNDNDKLFLINDLNWMIRKYRELNGGL